MPIANGVYSLPSAFFPIVAGSRTNSASMDAIFTDVAAGISAVAKKGARTIDVFDFLTPAQQNDVALNIGSIDVTAAVQAAVNAAAGQILLVPAGKYLLTTQINILQACQIMGVLGRSTFVLGTQNQNGFAVGDGTPTARAACFSTMITGIVFNPSQTVAAFSAGICIHLNYVAFVFVRDCTFYGSNGSANILFESVRAFQSVEWEIYKCRFSSMLGIGVNCFGTDITTQTVDGRIDLCEWTSVTNNDAVYVGTFANGITINSIIAYGTTHNVIHIDTTGAGKPYNVFILQPDIELDTSGIIAINCTDGFGLKQVVGGWIGLGSSSVAATAVNVGTTSAGLFWENVNCTQTNVVLSGPACTIVGGEISGDNSTTPTGITVNSTATDTQIIGVRVRQWTTAGIAFVGQPPRCMVDGVIFKANAVDFTGHNYTSLGLQPQIAGCRTDASNQMLPASSIVLHPALPFYQLVGASTTIISMSGFSAGQRVTFQAADSAGDAFGSGGNILLKTAPTTIPQFKSMSFVCDGANWFEDGRNF